MEHSGANTALVCRMHGRLLAIPVEHVTEIMRPLAVESLAPTPTLIAGLAVIRGVATPVVRGALLLGQHAIPPTRFVILKVGDRRVALAVDTVCGIQSLQNTALYELPSLLRDASAENVAAIGVLDEELLIVLRTARLVPDSLWTMLDAREVTS